MFGKTLASRGGVRVRQTNPSNLVRIALESEGEVPGKYEPVVMLDHQDLSQEPITVLLQPALVVGNLESVISPAISIKKTILRPETQETLKTLQEI